MNSILRKRFFPAAALLLFQVSLLLFSYHIVRGTDAVPEPVNLAQGDAASPDAAMVTNCRYGAVALSSAHLPFIDDLGAGWYLNFGPNAGAAPNNAEFAGIIYVRQNKDAQGNYLPTYTASPPPTPTGMGAYLDSRPSALWIVGNEVDRGPDPGQIVGGQGDTFPDVYAQAYHDIYHFIKSWDPKAQVAISALVQVTPGRLQYLDNLWDAYIDQYGTSIPVDVWNMHLYVLPEVNVNGAPNAIANVALGTDPALGKRESGGDPASCPSDAVYCFAEHDDMTIFNQQVIAMRTWMRNHGYQNRPLILSEFSILYPYQNDGGSCWLQDEFGQCFTSARVSNFLINSFSYLNTAVDPVLGYPKDNYRLIQQAMWFSISNSGAVGDVSDLITDDLQSLSQVGQTFKNTVNIQGNITINLFPSKVNKPVVPSNGGTATAKLTATILNNGNQPPGQQFFVTFYKDAALTQPIGTTSVPGPSPNNPGVAGCARRETTASVNWSALAPGLHPFWAKVDSTNLIVETNEGDNVISGFVIVDGQQILLPHMSR